MKFLSALKANTRQISLFKQLIHSSLTALIKIYILLKLSKRRQACMHLKFDFYVRRKKRLSATVSSCVRGSVNIHKKHTYVSEVFFTFGQKYRNFCCAHKNTFMRLIKEHYPGSHGRRNNTCPLNV